MMDKASMDMLTRQAQSLTWNWNLVRTAKSDKRL